MKKLNGFQFLLLQLVCAQFVSFSQALADDVRITAYYPSPEGEYQRLRSTGTTNLATGGAVTDIVAIGSNTNAPGPATRSAKLYVLNNNLIGNPAIRIENARGAQTAVVMDFYATAPLVANDEIWRLRAGTAPAEPGFDIRKINPVGGGLISTPFHINWADDNVGIGTTTPAANLHVNGSMYVNGGDGDINNDGTVFASDATAVLRYVNGLQSLTPAQIAKADVNGDGRVGYLDAHLILRVAVGLQTVAQCKSEAWRTLNERLMGVDSSGHIYLGGTIPEPLPDRKVTISAPNAMPALYIQGNMDGTAGTGDLVYIENLFNGTSNPSSLKVISNSNGGNAIYAFVPGATAASTFGIRAGTRSTIDSSAGVWGECTAGTGPSMGVYGSVGSPDGWPGVFNGGRGVRVGMNVAVGALIAPNGVRSNVYANDFYTPQGGGRWLSSIWVSSKRWKTNIKPLEGSLEKVQKLQGVSFDWKEGGKHDIGLIAEEVGKVIPELVGYEVNGVDAASVDYPHLTAVLVEAVKELKNENDALKSRIEVLEKK